MRIRVPGERKTWRLLRLAAINLAIFLVAFEACIYLFPGAIPLEIVARFPLRQRAYFAKQQHMNVASIFTGDQYLYYLNATAAAGQKPFSIDSNGYRNPEAPAPGSRLDVVLLGDSLMIAEAAAKDLGQLFRDDGATACNLGMGGYSPLHYTLAYEKFIAQQGITPRNVVITLCLANDLVDLEQAIDIYYNKHLTYFEYTNQQVVIQKQHLWPLTPFVLRGIVRMAAAKIRKAPQERAQVEFTTPFGTGKLDHLRLATMGITYIQRLDTPLGDKIGRAHV